MDTNTLMLSILWRPCLACLLVSVACAIIGPFVVVKRMTSMSGGLAHAAFGGIGLGFFLDFSPLLGAALFSVVSAWIVGLSYFRFKEGLDTLISMMWSVGMALGLIFISLKAGYAPDLNAYLFGNILMLPTSYLWIILGLNAVLLLLFLRFYHALKVFVFDEEFAAVIGLPVQSLFIGLLAFLALTVVVLIKAVGVLLTVALLTIPAACALQQANSMLRAIIWSFIWTLFAMFGGLLISYQLATVANVSIAPGPIMILIAVLCYALSGLALRKRLF